MKPKAITRPSAEQRSRLREIADRRLSPDEVRAGLAARSAPDEITEARALIRWFRRRYETPAARLAYIREAYARWMRNS